MASQIQGRRTIRQNIARLGVDPMAPADGRENRNIRMWDIAGDIKPGSTVERLRQAYHGALAAVDGVAKHRLAAASSGKFTEAGVTDDLARHVVSSAAPDFHRGRLVIKAAKQEARALRDKIKLQPANPGDIVGALHRREIREHLKSMAPKDRNAFVSRHRENMDPALALAICEMPSEFSGVLESDRAQLIDAALRAQHGEAMDELTALEAATEIAESAVETGRDEVRLETGLSQRDFDERAAPFEQKATGPKSWLKKQIENGKEVVHVIHERPNDIGKGVGLTRRVATTCR